MRLIVPIVIVLALLSPAAAEENVQTLGKRLVRALDDRTPHVIDAALDKEALIGRATRDLDLPADFLVGFRVGLDRALGLGNTLVQSLGGHGHATLLRFHASRDTTIAVVRVLAGEAVTYHELHLQARSSGAKLVDVLSYGTGELLSESLRRLTVDAAERANASFIDRLRRKTTLRGEHAGTIERLRTAVIDGRGHEGLDLFSKLPPELRRERTVLLARRDCAQSLGPTARGELDAANRDLVAALEHDPGSLLLVVTALSQLGHHEPLLAAIERLDVVVGGDPFLRHERALVLAAKGDRARALEEAKKAIAAEPDLAPPYWLTLRLLIQQESWKEAIALLDELEKKLKTRVGDLALDERFAPLAKRPEYREWRASRARH